MFGVRFCIGRAGVGKAFLTIKNFVEDREANKLPVAVSKNTQTGRIRSKDFPVEINLQYTKRYGVKDSQPLLFVQFAFSSKVPKLRNYRLYIPSAQTFLYDCYR